jgi:curved DNA-binding protein CbpA
VNYYEILQITPDASDEVIKAAYKALVKKYHPDNGAVNGTKKLQLLNEAYGVLSNPIRRKEYDNSLKADIVQTKTQKCTSRQGTCNSDNNEKANAGNDISKETTSKSKLGSAVRTFVRGISQELQRNHQIEENAYYDALNMSNYDLIQAFKKNYGLKRNGYARVLEERGLLVRQDEKLVPTDEFKIYWR